MKRIGPEWYMVMKDKALDAGDSAGVLLAERGAELWHRPPEEWELERCVGIGGWLNRSDENSPYGHAVRLAQAAHRIVGVQENRGAVHPVAQFLLSIPSGEPRTAIQGAAYLAAYMMLPRAEVHMQRADEERRFWRGLPASARVLGHRTNGGGRRRRAHSARQNETLTEWSLFLDIHVL